jgi:hypothetical protein
MILENQNIDVPLFNCLISIISLIKDFLYGIKSHNKADFYEK